MIKITNGVDYCQFSELSEDMFPKPCKKYCIRINEMMIKEIDDDLFGNYEYLEMVYNKFLRYNYPRFFKNPIRYLFGISKCYSWDKIRHA